MRTIPRPPRPAPARPAALLLLALLPAILLAGCRRKKDYPARPISIICPWAVGGGTDSVSRLMAHLLEEEAGVPVSVINRVGGGGVTGHTAGARARPDGYTAMMITVEIAMMHWRGLTEIGPGDFHPVMLVNRDAAAVFVRVDAPWRTLGELREAVRAKPGAVRASGTAIGGIWHLALAGGLIAMELPPDAIRWVPSNGAGPALQELASGGVDAVACSLPEARALMDGGTVRSLGVMAPERIEQYPDVPTFKEQGVDWSMGGWRGLALPRGAPPEIAARFEEIVRRVVDGEEFRDYMEKQGYDATVEGSERFARTMAADDRQFGELLERARITGEASGEPGPWFFPGVLALGLLATGAGLAIGALRRPRGTPPEAAGAAEAVEAGEAGTTPGGWIHFAEVLAVVAAYILLADLLGFLITGGGVTLYLLRRLGTGWLAAVLVTALLVPGTYALFGMLLRVPLPPGLIPW